MNANFAFLTPSLSYDANNVFLTLEQTVALASVAKTPNQVATAAAVQSLGSFNPVYGAAVTLATADQARAAFDVLSGEVHASTAGVLTEDSRYVRNAVLGRLRQAPFDSGPMASLSMGGPMLAYAADLPAKAAPFTSPPASTLTFWTQGFGAWAHSAATAVRPPSTAGSAALSSASTNGSATAGSSASPPASRTRG